MEMSSAKRIVKVSGTIQQMNDAFDVQLGHYSSEFYLGREGKISIPENVSHIVTGIFGLDNRRITRHRSRGPPGVSPLTPIQVAKLYNFPNAPASSLANQTIGLLEFGVSF